MNDNEFAELYQKELMINKIAKLVIETRQKAGMTQLELAEKVHITQPVIARIENSKDYQRLVSLELLSRIASAANAKMDISINF